MVKEKKNLLIVLVIFPLIYCVYSIMPLAKSLFIERNNSFYIPFWGMIIIFHWTSFFIVKYFLKQENKTFKDIGYSLNSKQTLILVLSYTVLAFLLFGFTEISLNYVTIDNTKLLKLSNFYPKTRFQRLLFIIMTFTAGFCEEIIYRGYAITKLVDIKMNKWITIFPSGMAFVFIHGLFPITSYIQFIYYFSFALVFGIIFILSKKLLPNIILHFIFDLMAMLAIFQAVA